ncbi:MAG: hypothetical protein HYZ38_22010 [Mycobacterium sp.]|nr:hypothetical protein [Mycobacterium sp.]
MPRMLKMQLSCAALAVALAGCGGAEQSSEATSSTQLSSSPKTSSAATSVVPAPTAADFAGPVFYQCGKAGPVLRKLNLDSGVFSAIASYPNVDCDNISRSLAINDSDFIGQTQRHYYSPDYSKVAVSAMPDSFHTGYYDHHLDRLVDVTEIVAPMEGDFAQPAHHEPGYFTDDGTFVFWDQDKEVFQFFDTNSRQVVRNSPAREMPASLAPAIQVKGTEDYFNQGTYKTCDGRWMIDGSKYLRTDGYQPTAIFLSTVPEGPLTVGTCEAAESLSTRVSPKSTTGGYRNESIAADPTGSTIIFVYRNQDSEYKLFRANPSNPDNPAEIPLKGSLEDYPGDIIAWS